MQRPCMASLMKWHPTLKTTVMTSATVHSKIRPSLPLTITFLFAFVSVIAQQPQCTKPDAEVLILGAGMSGVNAARTLYDAGVTDFIIIEGKSEMGGRMKHAPLRPGGGEVELGAGWIAGYDRDQPESHPLIALAQRCGGIKGNISNYDSFIAYNTAGSVVSDDLDYDGIGTAYEDASAISLSRQANEEGDITVREALLESNWTVVSDEDKFLDWYYFDYCFGEPPQNTSLFYAQPSSTYSAEFGNASYAEDLLVTDQMGFVKLVECLADGILGVNNSRLLLNTKVNVIIWSDECVCVETESNGQTKQYCANYAIITFSIGVLQSTVIQFEPDLPQWKQDVINTFSMAHYIVLYTEFPTVFWDDVEFIGHVSDARGYLPLFLSQNLFLPPGNNVLEVTATGDVADRLLLQTEEETMNEILEVLRGIYGSNVTEPTAFLRSEWLTDPYFFGSFSHIPLGVTDQTFIDLAAPTGRVYFSGEATSQNYYGFVHGAYFAGRDSAKAVIDAMSGSVGTVANVLLVLCAMLVMLLVL